MAKNQSNKVALVILAALALLGVFIWRYQKAKSRFDWRDSVTKHAYSETSEEPYATQIARRLLSEYFENAKLTDLRKKLAVSLPKHSAGRENYVFIGEAMFLDSLDLQTLLDFVGRGNTAFISSKTIPNALMDSVYQPACGGELWSDYSERVDTAARFRLETPDLGLDTSVSFVFSKRNRPAPYRWHYMGYQYFCEENGFALLGTLNDTLANFAEMPFRKGRFLMHANPVAFTNFFLLQNLPRKYASGVFSHLEEGDIYWDAISRTDEMVGRRRNEGGFGPRRAAEEHALTYILKQPALAWMWYILLALGLTWLIFRSKRRQRIIPVLPKNENASLEFISTIAHLHFREGNFKSLSIRKMKIFLAQLRERYGFSVAISPETGLPKIDEAFLTRLSRVSEIPDWQVRKIFEQFEAIARFQPTQEMAGDFHLAVEAFWKKAK